MAERIVPITGMTCAACEETVSTAVLALDGVAAARADRRTGRLVLTGGALPSDAAIDRALVGGPYGVGRRPWLSRDHHVWRDLAVAVAVVGALAMLAWALGLDSAVARLTAGASTGSALVVLGLGVAASLSTCMALVGGLVVSLSATTASSATGIARLVPHLAFNAGRIVGFAALGALVGLVGRSIAPSGVALAAIVVAAAIVMTVVGVRLTGVSPRVAAWQVSLPASWGRWARTDAAADGGTMRAALLGAATFFLPCGFTQAVQVYALSTGSPREGGIVMGLFAIGTAPGLVAAGAAATTARRGSGRALHAVGVVVIAFALITASGAVTQLAPGLTAPTAVAAERTSNVVDRDGAQLATTRVVADGYEPTVTVVYAGEPVRWHIDPHYQGCQSLIDARSLGFPAIDVLFEPATVTFTPTEPGTYPYSCAMGMYTGSFVVIERPAA